MTRARWWTVAGVVAGLLAVTIVGSAVEPTPEAAQTPRATDEPVTGTVQVCPGPDTLTDVTADVAAVALDGVDDGDLGPGTLLLQSLPGGDQSPETLGTVDVRGETIAAQADVPVGVRADAGLAPGVAAEVVASAESTRTSGLAGATCVEPGREFWFAAGSGQVGERTSLVVTNPATAPAVVDVTVWTEDGQVAAAGTQDLGVPPTGSREISIDAVATGSERTAVRVTASLGRVGAFLALREVDGADPLGLTWVSPSVLPAELAYVPGIPRFGERVLRLVNPGEQDAIASVRAIAGSGPFTPVGLEAIDVPAGRVVDVDLEPVGDEALAVEVSASQPVVSAVRLRQTPSSGLSDIAVVGAAPALDAPAASRVLVENGRSTRVVLTALPDQVPAEGAPDLSTPTPDPGASQTADATPTAATSPDASDAPSPTQEAEQSPEESAQPSPSPTDDELVELADPATVEVVVRIVDIEGATLERNVATLAVGTTDTFPVDLPEDVTQAWVVLEAREPGTVLAARETTTTVSVPDALDPEAERDAFWLDLVPLRSTTVTVAVPPVRSDVRAGLAAQSDSSS